MSKKIKNEDIKEALKKSIGNISNAARILGISRTTIHSRINIVPELKEVYEEYRDQAIDNAESSLQRAVLNGEGWAVCFTLKTIGKNRGYTEKIEQEISGEQKIKIIIEDVGTEDQTD